MCRNIHTLFNFEPPATDEEVRGAALQYVRKVSGFTKPSQANEEAFDRAVDEIATASRRLLDSLVTSAARSKPSAPAHVRPSGTRRLDAGPWLTISSSSTSTSCPS
jgi:hypothetical protein